MMNLLGCINMYDRGTCMAIGKKEKKVSFFKKKEKWFPLFGRKEDELSFLKSKRNAMSYYFWRLKKEREIVRGEREKKKEKKKEKKEREERKERDANTYHVKEIWVENRLHFIHFPGY